MVEQIRESYSFGVQERLALLDVLPVQASARTLRLVRHLRSVLEISPEEGQRLQMVRDGARLDWNADADTGLECQLELAEVETIKATLLALDQREALTLQQLPLFERFCGGD